MTVKVLTLRNFPSLKCVQVTLHTIEWGNFTYHAIRSTAKEAFYVACHEVRDDYRRCKANGNHCYDDPQPK